MALSHPTRFAAREPDTRPQQSAFVPGASVPAQPPLQGEAARAVQTPAVEVRIGHLEIEVADATPVRKTKKPAAPRAVSPARYHVRRL
jgi:hypothetical protein